MDQLPPGIDPSTIPLLPPPDGKSSNFIDPPSLASVSEGVGGLLIAVETLLLILRTYSNLKAFRKLRLEDYWTIFAAILTYGYFALIMRFRPIARHQWDIPLTASTPTLYKTVFAQEMMLGSTVFFSKSSLLLLYYRIFSPDRIFRYKLYAAFVFIAITTLSSIPMYLAVCIPGKHSSWAEASAKCSKTDVYGYVQGPANVIFDVFAIYLPASVIINLHMPLRRKIGVLAIFTTGTLALIASIIGLVYRVKLIHDSDGTWAAFIVELCLFIESCVSIICACMPSIPSIAKLIAHSPVFLSLQSRLRSLYLRSANRSKNSNASSSSLRRKAFPPSNLRNITANPSSILPGLQPCTWFIRLSGSAA